MTLASRYAVRVMPTQSDLTVPILGAARFESPLRAKGRRFPDPAIRVRYQARVGSEELDGEGLTFEKAGPRERIFFDPAETTAAFVTCGGLAPGLNNTIRSGFYELTRNYGVGRVLGIREGYKGLDRWEYWWEFCSPPLAGVLWYVGSYMYLLSY